ncbi:membrane protein [Kosakonia radicincitans UMEnt01/12]|nr:membrane protein [Kosakonia radicincitans UMEnt01/12]
MSQTVSSETLPEQSESHPRAFAPATLLLLLVLSIFGSVIGVQLLTTLGVTPNTAIIGAMAAMIIARIPLQCFARFRSIHIQNLAQSATSAATFGAANSLLLPISIPWLFGHNEMVMPMFIGVALAMLLDGWLLYRLFNTRIFPAEGAWPPGIAAAESIKAGDQGGKQAALLGTGMVIGAVGSWFKFPMAALGTAFIGNIWALSMLGVGFLLRGYSGPLFGIDINKLYIPHGVMAGAGVVALFQIIRLIRQSNSQKAAPHTADDALPQAQNAQIGKTIRLGALGFMAISVLIALGSGLYAHLSLPWLVAFMVYAAFAAFLHEMIVGLAAMHSGWFPAFAVALITLLIGILIGFPPQALAMLCGFSAATGPAFADMGYDLKAGWILRGKGEHTRFELEGRRQQLLAAMLAFVVAMPVVLFIFRDYFSQGLVPPVAKVYVAAINAGVSFDIAKSLLIWAIPGAVIQLIGGPGRQMGVLLATGLLINNPLAGWAVMIGIAIRAAVLRVGGEPMRNKIEVLAAGLIAGDALFSFFNSVLPGGKK